MSGNKVAVVTGANKGIGFAIVKGLCEKFDGIVYLTARNVDNGKKAVESLNKLNLKPTFHQLDITNKGSISKFADFIKTSHGGIDVLVNNAAIAYKNAATEPFSEQAKVTVEVNYFALLDVCNALFPLLRPNARVVNLSSSAGHLLRIPSQDLQNRFKHSSLTVDQLNQLMNEFVEAAAEGKHKELGWGESAYSVSKVGVTALTRIQQREFDVDPRGIAVNAVHPGYVATDMSSFKGPLTIEQGTVPKAAARTLTNKVFILSRRKRSNTSWHASTIRIHFTNYYINNVSGPWVRTSTELRPVFASTPRNCNRFNSDTMSKP